MTAAEALGCQACRLPITPCLVCASPLPVPRVDDPLIKTCRGCGVVNPLDGKYREVLDIPPASALPSAMVRRVQIARVGRRPYVLAKHAHFMHLSPVSKKKDEDERDGGSESHGLVIQEIFARLGPKGSPVPEIFASAEEGHPLTFLPYMQDTGARMHQEAVLSGRKAVDARRFYPFSDSESPVKRMSVIIPCHSSPSSFGLYTPSQAWFFFRVELYHAKGSQIFSLSLTFHESLQSRRLSPRQEVDEGEKNLSGSGCPTLHQVQVPACNEVVVAAALIGRTSSMCTPLKHDPANLGELAGKLAASSGFTVQPLVLSNDSRSTPVETKCKDDPRPSISDVEDEEKAQRHEGGAEAPTSGAAVSNESVDQRRKYFEHDFYPQVQIENLGKLPSTSLQKVDAEEIDAHDVEDNFKSVRDVTGSEEVHTRRHERVCTECGQTGGASRSSSSNVDEAELMRCCTQILELHCPHTLKADMRSPCAYPLCCPVPRFPLPAGNSTSSSKVCRSYVTQFSVDALRAAHSTLTSSTQELTSAEVTSPLRGVEQALLMAERFIEIKDKMVHVQGLIQQVDAASAQVSRDLKAFGDHGAFSLASQLIPGLLSREKQHNVDRAKEDVQVMTAFLQDINKLLTTCFQYVGKILEASLCSLADNRADSNAMNLNVFMLDIDTKPGLEAVRAAVPLWLRMYHDVAHASGLLK